MRFLLLVAMTWMTSTTGNAGILFKWPDANISVPPLVHEYIVEECNYYKGFSEESIYDCIIGERYGYRAVVMMLADSKLGDEFAERYRACAAGLGDFGGRFHRRKAECMSCVLRYLWRFEFTRQASMEQPGIVIETFDRAGLPGAMPLIGLQRAEPRAVPSGAPLAIAQN